MTPSPRFRPSVRAALWTLALLLIDLDNLFLINHERGRPAGDLALQALADALRRSAHDHQTVARLAGDQFAMLLPGTALATPPRTTSSSKP